MNKKLPLIILTSFTASHLQAQNSSFYFFATTFSPVTLNESNDGTGNPITYTSTSVATGTSTAGTNHGEQTIQDQ